MQEQWYYSMDRSQREGPVAIERLREMIQQGVLPPTTLVWTEGMADWAPASDCVPMEGAPPIGIDPPPPGTAESPAPIGVEAVHTAQPNAEAPANLAGWMRFVGVMTIVVGALYTASCFGILWGVLMIIGGVALLGARTALDGITGVPPNFVPFLEKLNTFFLVTGIMYIVMIIGTVLMLIFYGGMIIAAITSGL